MIEFCLYYSKCIDGDFTATDLDIFRVSIKANDANNITGFLHREAGYYLQYYEGEKPNVAQLTQNLMDDDRHHSFTIIDQGNTPSRTFDGWSMGYANTAKTTLGLKANDENVAFSAQDVTKFLIRASEAGASGVNSVTS